MKQTFISASIVAMLSTGAIAGNIDTPTADSVIAPPPNLNRDRLVRWLCWPVLFCPWRNNGLLF